MTAVRTPLMLMLASATIALGACASSRTVTLSVTEPDGAPMAGALVNASPIGLSVSPLPVSSENLREADIQRGTGGVTDRDGTVRLTMESPYEYEIRLQPNPMGEDARRGVAWLWAIGGDGAITPIDGLSRGEDRPVIRIVD